MPEPAAGRASPSRPGPCPERIALVGFMGAGKSTVGRILARTLGWEFVDLDEEVERLAGRTIPEIFRAGGEAAFRRLEAQATTALDDRRRFVVATGGGWMARPELRDRWPGTARVWLAASLESVQERLAGRFETRPLLDPGSPERAMQAILRARLPAYELAEIRVDTDGRSAIDVAGRVLELLGLSQAEEARGGAPADHNG